MNHDYKNLNGTDFYQKSINDQQNKTKPSLNHLYLNSFKRIGRILRSFSITVLINIYHLIKKINQNIKGVTAKLSASFFYSLVIFIIIALMADYAFALAGNLENKWFLFLNEELFEKKVVVKKILSTDNELMPENQNLLLDKDFKIAAIEEYPVVDDPKISTTLGGAALINTEGGLSEQKILERTTVESYTIQPGDTISSIAQKFNLSIQTILWENNLTAYSILRPGQELKILPLSGVTHKIKKGDTIESIAKKYQASTEDILDFNNLADASDIYINDLLIIPEGKIPPPPPRPKPKLIDKKWLAKQGLPSSPEGTNCHTFVPGQCTWYVARKRCIPWAGHAKSWIANAQRLGFTISSNPAVGAVISTREGGWWGHVSYVESFDEETVTFSEMNHTGPWVITKRTLKRNDRRIIGYIL